MLLPTMPLSRLVVVALLAALDPASAQSTTPATPPATPPSAPAEGAPAAPPAAANTQAQLQILPRPLPLARVYDFVTTPIADEATRLELERRIRALWEGYLARFEVVQLEEFVEARAKLTAVSGDRPPTPDALRGSYATALAAVDRLDAMFLADLKTLVSADSAEALAALERSRLRAVSAIGLAGHLSLSVPMRWVEPMAWLEVTESRIPMATIIAYDLEVTRLSKDLAPARRRFEFEMVGAARTQSAFSKALPEKGKPLVVASRDAALASRAAVAALLGPVQADDVARIQIARVEDLYFDTPRPERAVTAESFPADEALRDAWFAERAKLAISDAEIVLRYEDLALKTLAAKPLWDRQAYDGRKLLAKSFKEERSRLHDEIRAKLELLSGQP